MCKIPDYRSAQISPGTLMTQSSTDLDLLAQQIKDWGREFGFAHIGISPASNEAHALRLREWLAKQYHGDMAYMAEREGLRGEAAELHSGTIRVISARMDYLPDAENMDAVLGNPDKA